MKKLFTLRVKLILYTGLLLLVILGVSDFVHIKKHNKESIEFLKDKAKEMTMQVLILQKSKSTCIMKEINIQSNFKYKYKLLENPPDKLFKIEKIKGKRYVEYVIPLRNEACIHCHKNKYLLIFFPAEKDLSILLHEKENLIIQCIILMTVIAWAIYLILRKEIIIPLDKIKRIFDKIKNGVYNVEDDFYLGKTKELKQLSKDLKDMVVKLKNMVENISSEKAKYETLFENSIEPIFILSLNGEILNLNYQAVKLLGGENKEELKGKNLIRDFLISLDKEKDFLNKLRTSKDKIYTTVDMKKLNGQKITVEVGCSKLKELNGILVTMRDVTCEKLLEKQLIQAQRMEAIATLTSGIAHDFRNILAAGLGFLELSLQEVEKDTSLYRRLNLCYESLKRGVEITNQLLSFSKIKKEKPIVTDINLLIKDLVKMMKETFLGIVEIVEELDPNLKKVMINPSQIHQALLNICINAKDAMPNGGRLTIKTKNVYLDKEYCKAFLDLKEGEYVCIYISDTGYGINKENLNKIFEPFFTTKELGTGLGLSVAYAIIKSYKGHINVYSEEGKGTTFKIYLPAIKYEPEEERKEASKSLKKGEGTILVVDDEKIVREVFGNMLLKLGYKVISAADGCEAVKLYRQKYKDIDLVVLDIFMPKMNGVETLKKLKKINSNVKAVAFSGYYDPKFTDKLKKLGIKIFIDKPYNQREVAEIIWKAINS